MAGVPPFMVNSAKVTLSPPLPLVPQFSSPPQSPVWQERSPCPVETQPVRAKSCPALQQAGMVIFRVLLAGISQEG